MNPLRWFWGYADVTADHVHAAELLELCRRRGYVYENFRSTPDGKVTLRMTRPTARAVMEYAIACQWACAITRRGGLPSLMRWCGRRVGVVIGLFLGVCLLIASGFFVWDVRVSGTETLTEQEVEDTLAACGFGVGSSLVGFRADRLENRSLLYNNRLAWISVNVRGTVAHVQVREAIYPADPPSTAPANIVAARGGTIEWVELGQGNLLVKAGDVVGEGEILVSGLYDSLTMGLRVTRAQAKVYARTAREFTVEIPLTYEKKTYVEEKEGAVCEKSFNFFGKSVNFLKNTGNIGSLYDTIEETVSWGLPSRWSEMFHEGREVGFPLSMTTVCYRPYILETARRTPAEAEALAYAELAQQIEASPDTTLLQKNITTTLTDTGYRLQCTVICIENIAATVEFEVTQ